MVSSAFRLLWRAINDAINHMSASLWSVAVGLILFALWELRRYRIGGTAAMKMHWKSDGLSGFIFVAAAWIVTLAWSIAETTYNDHIYLKNIAQTRLEQIQGKDGKGGLNAQVADLQRQLIDIKTKPPESITNKIKRVPTQLSNPPSNSVGGSNNDYNTCGFFAPNNIVKIVTPLANKSNSQLRELAKYQNKSLTDLENRNRADTNAIASDKDGVGVVETQKKLDEVSARQTTEFQLTQLVEARALENELLTRLALPHPTDNSDGLSSDGYCAIMSGIIRSDSALSSIGKYLVNLSRKLPS